MKIIWRLLLGVAALFVMPVAAAWAQGSNAEARQDQVKEAARDAEREGTIVDGATGTPIAGAIVTAGDKTVLTDAQGHYRALRQPAVAGPCRRLRPLDRRGKRRRTADHRAQALRPKALYLTVYGIGAPFLLDPALDVIEKSASMRWSSI